VSSSRPDPLPHAYPFRLVERAEVVADGRVAVVLGTMGGSLSAAEGWPVTLVAEALAQSILLVDPPVEASAPRLAALNRVRLLRPLRAGTRFEVEVRRVAALPPLRRYECRATEAGALAATAEITVSG